jgi:hypothetical protein
MSRQGRLDVRRQRPPRRPPPVPASTPAARAQDRLDGFRNAAGFMLTAVELLLNNTYAILILLDRARRIPTVLRQVLCEVMGRLDRTCHNFVTVFRCGERAHAFGPPKSKLIQRV